MHYMYGSKPIKKTLLHKNSRINMYIIIPPNTFQWNPVTNFIHYYHHAAWYRYKSVGLQLQVLTLNWKICRRLVQPDFDTVTKEPFRIEYLRGKNVPSDIPVIVELEGMSPKATYVPWFQQILVCQGMSLSTFSL